MRNLTAITSNRSTHHEGHGHDGAEQSGGQRIEGANPTGTRFKDILIGIDAADTVTGLAESDVLRGMAGDDTLIGVNKARKTPGRDEIDALYGGLGADTFVLGDLRGGVFYLDKGNKGAGRKSYAGIQDYEAGDTISLRCYEMGEYVLDTAYKVGNSTATAIYYNKDNKPGISKGDDLVAIVQGSAASYLDLMNNKQFNWII